jgi:tRNA (guanine37-N1)-methyltransferase
MRFDILTLFPEMFAGPFTESIIKRAQEANLISIHLHNIRDYATDKHRMADDTPFGGGGGMVMKPEPLVTAIEDVRGSSDCPVILMTPQGRRFNQRVAQELSSHERLILVCGRYEGVDERVREQAITDEISIGDFVLTGGELPAMMIVDAVSRLIPGVLGAEHGAAQDSHATGLLEHPHYTRPAEFRGSSVPDVLQEGHHAKIDSWRRQESLRRTWQRRPDMLLAAPLTEDERWFLAELAKQST